MRLLRPLLIALAAAALIAPAGALAAPGDLDGGFSNNGLVTGADPLSAEAIAVAPNGWVTVAGAGTTPGQLTLRRFLADGQSHPGFGNDGIRYELGAPARVRALVAAPDGSLYLGGEIGSGAAADFFIARVLPEGSLDPAFAGTGVAQIDFAGMQDRLTGLALAADGTVLATGLVRTPVGLQVGAARVLATGALDGSFAGTGKLVADSGGLVSFAEDAAIAPGPSGTVVLAGGGPAPDGSAVGDVVVRRYLANGDPDPSFGDGDGWSAIGLDSRDDATSIAVDGLGYVKVGIDACAVGLVTSCRSAIAAFVPSGAPDSSFGGDGLAEGFPGNLIAAAPNGGFYAAGSQTRSDAFGLDFAVSRLNSNGALDPTFSGDGTAHADFALGQDFATDIAVDGSGRAVLGGVAGGVGHGVARFGIDAGPADADADRVLDGDDRCPARFGPKSNEGCPKIVRGLTLRRIGGGRVKVTLNSEIDACFQRQRLQIVDSRKKRRVAARVRTNNAGIAKTKELPTNRYRASIKRHYVPEIGRCARASSRAVTIQR